MQRHEALALSGVQRADECQRFRSLHCCLTKEAPHKRGAASCSTPPAPHTCTHVSKHSTTCSSASMSINLSCFILLSESSKCEQLMHMLLQLLLCICSAANVQFTFLVPDYCINVQAFSKPTTAGSSLAMSNACISASLC